MQFSKFLASSTFFDIFSIKGSNIAYSLRSCARIVKMVGRRTSGYLVKSIDGQTYLYLPTFIEIPTKDAAVHHPHLKHIVHFIPDLDPQAQIVLLLVLLLGRDIFQVHKVRAQINGVHNAPYAQKLDIGWVIIRDICQGNMHKSTSVNSMLTKTLENGHLCLFQPCHNHFPHKEIAIHYPLDFSLHRPL